MSTKDALRAVATGQAEGQIARSPYEGLKHSLEASKREFLPLLGNNQANVDKFIRVVLNAVMANPDLLEADRRSLVMSCLRAAQDGLLPDGREAMLNIYNTKDKSGGVERWVKKAQYLPMVGGLIKKMYESGEVVYVDACCVYAGDVFKHTRGDDPKITHEPMGEGEFDDIVAAYCIVKLKNGETKREVMWRRDIERVRAASKSASNGPWVTWFDQQAIKSVIKRIYKQIPRSDTWEQVERSDNEASGYAALGPSIQSTLEARQSAPAADASATPALGHSEPDTLDMPMNNGAGLQEEARTQSVGEGERRDSASRPHQPQQDLAGMPPEPPPEEGTMSKSVQKRVATQKNASPPQSVTPSTGDLREPLDKPYAALADMMGKVTNADAGWMVLDEARHLPEQQQGELLALLRQRFPDA